MTRANNKRLRMVMLADSGHVNTQRWCEALSAAGADIHLITVHKPGRIEAEVYPLPTSRFPRQLQYFAALFPARRLIRQIHPDVVVAYYATGYGILGALAGQHPLVIVTAGGDLFYRQSPEWLYQRLVRYTLNQADLVTAWAPHMAEAVQGYGVPPERILTLPRGIPTAHFIANRRLRPNNHQPLRLICTRELKRNNNVHLLLDAVALLNNTGRPVSVTIAGEGVEKIALQEQAAQSGIADLVTFTGFVPNDELPELLTQHDIYIALVPFDGVSASLLEAMITGLFPIVTDHPANRNWITQGENGLLVSLTPESVSAAIAEAADQPMRERAWQMNHTLVQTRADQFRNADCFINRFQMLAKPRPR